MQQTQATQIIAPAVTKPLPTDRVADLSYWGSSNTYDMSPCQTPSGWGDDFAEGGSVRFAWDADYLYVRGDLVDSHVCQSDNRDQQHHYQTGDVMEVFLKPENAEHYWELYVTPNGRRTTFFFPSKAHLKQPGIFEGDPSWLHVAAEVDGELNNADTTDRGWTGQYAISREVIAQHGVELSPGVPWRVLIGRYNATTDERNPQLSCLPKLPKANFHDLDNYAHLILQPTTNP